MVFRGLRGPTLRPELRNPGRRMLSAISGGAFLTFWNSCSSRCISVLPPGCHLAFTSRLCAMLRARWVPKGLSS